MRKMVHHMIGGLALLILLSKLSQNEDAVQKIPLSVVKPGDNVTLTCQIPYYTTAFYFHKLKFGYIAQTVAAGYNEVSLQGQFNTSRFTATKEDFLYRFVIRNVSKEDEATYLCQQGSAYKMSFTNGTVLIVDDYKGPNSLQVKQSKSVDPGGSVTFQCSLPSKNEENGDACPAEHNVIWFRAGSGESQPSILYPLSHCSDDQEGRRCFYTLTKTVNASDTGNYYCAVEACGQIIFGGGSTLQPTDAVFPFTIVIGILSVCCTMLLAALIISRVTTLASQCSNHHETGEVLNATYVTLDFPVTERQEANMEQLQTRIYSVIQD